MKRITVIMPDEVEKQVIQLAKKEKRSKSAMAALLIEDGLKFVNPEKDLVSFGNFMLAKHGIDSGVADWDLSNWRDGQRAV